MEGKWYIIEEFGRIGPFSYRELLGGVERGDYDYSVRLESEQSGRRTNLTELMNRAKKAPPSKFTPVRQRSTHRRRRTTVSRAPSRPRVSIVKIESILKNFIIALTGSVVALGLFFFFKKVDLSQLLPEEKPPKQDIITLDLPSNTDKRLPAAFDNVTKISALPSKTKQTVRIGPVRFSRKQLRNCKVKCRLLVTDSHGASVTAIFFSQSFRSKLTNTRGKSVYLRGIVSAKGNELYLQSVSYR
ncbi:MAG: hypothetical protein OYH77_04130 [Pseudomonadota bacterium]|nr:hypothetical protein [Pseudomonadota bacterium]